MEQQTSSQKPTRITLVNLGTLGFVVAWLAFSCYAVAYLVSH